MKIKDVLRNVVPSGYRADLGAMLFTVSEQKLVAILSAVPFATINYWYDADGNIDRCDVWLTEEDLEIEL